MWGRKGVVYQWDYNQGRWVQSNGCSCGRQHPANARQTRSATNTQVRPAATQQTKTTSNAQARQANAQQSDLPPLQPAISMESIAQGSTQVNPYAITKPSPQKEPVFSSSNRPQAGTPSGTTFVASTQSRPFRGVSPRSAESQTTAEVKPQTRQAVASQAPNPVITATVSQARPATTQQYQYTRPQPTDPNSAKARMAEYGATTGRSTGTQHGRNIGRQTALNEFNRRAPGVFRIAARRQGPVYQNVVNTGLTQGATQGAASGEKTGREIGAIYGQAFDYLLNPDTALKQEEDATIKSKAIEAGETVKKMVSEDPEETMQVQQMIKDMDIKADDLVDLAADLCLGCPEEAIEQLAQNANMTEEQKAKLNDFVKQISPEGLKGLNKTLKNLGEGELYNLVDELRKGPLNGICEKFLNDLKACENPEQVAELIGNLARNMTGAALNIQKGLEAKRASDKETERKYAEVGLRMPKEKQMSPTAMASELNKALSAKPATQYTNYYGNSYYSWYY